MSTDLAEARVPPGAAARGAGVVLLATAVTVDPAGLRPFTTARWAVVGVSVALAAAAAPWRVPRRLAAAGLAFGACLVVATIVALDPLLAVVGHPRRHLGLAGWLVCALAFAAGTAVQRPGDGGAGRRHLGRAAVVAGLATGGAALADWAGWDPAGVTFAGGRVGGLLGQPAYLGALAVVLAPVAAGVAADGGAGRAWRVAGGVAAATCGAALVASQTRGAWLGAAVAAAVVVPRLWRGRRPRSGTRGDRAVVALGRGPRPPGRAGAERAAPAGAAQRVAAAGTVALAALAILAAVALAGPLGARLAATVDPAAPGGRSRVDEWALALAVVRAHPLTGVGPEGYRIAAPAHIDGGYARRHGRDEVVDRAHDGPLDVAAAAGIPAAVLYAALVGVAVAAAVGVARRGRDPVLVGAALAVVAWAVQQLVSFPSAEVDPAAWLLAGVVVAAAAPAGAPGPARPARQWGRRSLAAALAVVLAAAGVTAVAADRDLDRAQRGAGGAPGGPAAVAAADRATALRPDDVDAWYVAARVAASGPSLLAVDAGLDRVEDGLRRAPRDPALADLHEALLVERALRSSLPADLRAAESACRARIAADPAGPAHHRLLGLVLARGGATRSEAGAELRRALALDPGDQTARRALAGLAEDGR